LVEDFRDLLVAFADGGVEFVLIGGWALALHGYARGTDDMDVFVRPTRDNAQRVIAALVAFGAPIAAHQVSAEVFEKEGLGYRMGVKPHLIEVLTKIDGVSFDSAVEDAKTFLLDGREIRFIGRAAMMRNKRAAGRPKDLADLAWLESHHDPDND
jgi:hypothetical protein